MESRGNVSTGCGGLHRTHGLVYRTRCFMSGYTKSFCSFFWSPPLQLRALLPAAASSVMAIQNNQKCKVTWNTWFFPWNTERRDFWHSPCAETLLRVCWAFPALGTLCQDLSCLSEQQEVEVSTHYRCNTLQEFIITWKNKFHHSCHMFHICFWHSISTITILQFPLLSPPLPYSFISDFELVAPAHQSQSAEHSPLTCPAQGDSDMGTGSISAPDFCPSDCLGLGQSWNSRFGFYTDRFYFIACEESPPPLGQPGWAPALALITLFNVTFDA